MRKLAFAFICFFSLQSAFADFTWTGGGGDDDIWSNSDNWQGGNVPSGTSASISFPSSHEGGSINDISGLRIATLNVTTSTSGYSIEGPVLASNGLITYTANSPSASFASISSIRFTGPSGLALANGSSITQLVVGDISSSAGSTGTWTVVLASNAILEMLGVNTYTQDTEVFGHDTPPLGIVLMGGPNEFPSGTTVTFSENAALDLNGLSEAFSTFSMDNTCAIFNGNNAHMATLVLNGNASISGTIGLSGSASIAVDVNGGTLTTYLNNIANAYTGGTTINGSALTLAGYGSAGTGTITLEAASLNLPASSGTLNNVLDITSGYPSDVYLYGDTNATISGVIVGSAALDIFSKGAAATAVLTGTNTSFSGGIDVLAPITLSIIAANNLGTGNLTLEGGTISPLASVTIPNTIIVILNSGMTSGGGVTTAVTGTISGSSGSSLTLSGAGTNSPSIVEVDTGTFTIAGNIGSGQNLTKTGAGTLVLNGTNNQTSTILSGGTLDIGAAADLGSGNVAMHTGTLSLTNTVTLTNTFSIAGDSTISSSGTTNITGVVTGSDGKTLTITGTNDLPNVAVNSSDSFKIKGVIGGTSLTKTGTGKLVLPSANNYSGATNLNAGSISLNTSSSALGNGTINMATGTTLLFDADGIALSNPIALTGNTTIDVSTGTTVLSGNITGGTTLTTKGPGTLKIEGTANTPTGVIANSGIFTVVGTLTTTSGLTVSDTAILAGTGNIFGNVTNSGILSPGLSPGTLTIHNGTYTQMGGIVLNEITPTETDLVVVHSGGFVIENSPTFIVLPDVITGYAAFQSYTVVSVDAPFTVSGTFAPPISVFPLANLELTYNTTSVILSFGFNNILDTFSFKGNPGYVAAALDIMRPANIPHINDIYSTLLGLTGPETYLALDHMHPALFKGMAIAQENNAVQVRNAVSERFLTLLDSDPCFTCEDKSKKRPFLLWASGLGDFLHQGDTRSHQSPQEGYRVDTGGIIAGIDYNFWEVCYLGALGAYTYSNVKWAHQYGKGTVNDAYAGLYFSAIGSRWYGNFSTIGVLNSYNTHRNVIYPGVDETANSHHGGEQLISHFDTGFNWNVRSLTVRPFGSLDWIIQHENAFTESGAGIYDLDVKNSRANMLRTEAGLNFASCGYFRSAKFSADTKFSWVRENRLSGTTYQSTFIGTDVPFIVYGYFPNRNLFSCGVTLSAALLQELVTCTAYENGEFDHKYVTRGDILNISAYYNGVFGSKYQDNTVGLRLSYAF